MLRRLLLQLMDDAQDIRTGFYNVAICNAQVEARRWQHKQKLFRRDIVRALMEDYLHILCLCELGDISTGLADSLRQPVRNWILGLLANTNVGKVSIYVHGHYATIVKTEQIFAHSARFIQGFFSHQPWRSFQHFRVRLRTGNEVISIINALAVSTEKKRLTTERRIRYFPSSPRGVWR